MMNLIKVKSESNSEISMDDTCLNKISSNSNSTTIKSVNLYGSEIVSLKINGQERLCLAQISNTLLDKYSYNEIHNRRVALGITCVQCTPVQLDQLRRAGAMPISSRRCGMITKREAERLVKSFLDEITPPKLPINFQFNVKHSCGWGGFGSFLPARYNSSRAKCIKCHHCQMFFSPNKFIFHCHKPDLNDIQQNSLTYHHPDAANFNAWRRHLILNDELPSESIMHAWEDVKAMFNGGNRKRLLHQTNIESQEFKSNESNTPSKSTCNLPKDFDGNSSNPNNKAIWPTNQYKYPQHYHHSQLPPMLNDLITQQDFTRINTNIFYDSFHRKSLPHPPPMGMYSHQQKSIESNSFINSSWPIFPMIPINSNGQLFQNKDKSNIFNYASSSVSTSSSSSSASSSRNSSNRKRHFSKKSSTVFNIDSLIN